LISPVPLLDDLARGRARLGVERDARALEQLEGRDAARHHEDLVVGEREGLGPAGALHREVDRVGADREDVALHREADAALLDAALEAPLRLRADADEAVAAVGERHLVARLLGEADRRLDRAVAAAHHEDAPSLVGLRVEQAVGDLRQLLARHAEPPRQPAPAEREADVARDVLARLGLDDVGAVGAARDAGEGLVVPHVQLVLRGDRPPELHELFLGEGRRLQAAVQRHLDRLRDDQLAPRVLRDRAAERRLVLERHVVEAAPLRLERAGEPGRPGADDAEVDDPGLLRRLRRLEPARDRARDGDAVVDGGLDQRVRRHLAGEEEAGRADRLELVGDDRDVGCASRGSRS
jgi:hypothetical protein